MSDTSEGDVPPPRARRQQILDVAAHMFVERGFRGTSIDDLGAAVGVTGPALYRHFPAKEALLAEILIGVSEELLRGARVRTSPSRDGSALTSLVEFHVDFALDHPELITVQSRDLDCLSEADQERVRELQRSYVELWIDTVVAAKLALSRSRARAAVHAAFGLMNSTPFSARLERNEMHRLLTDMAIAAIASSALASSPRQ
ncbi:MAG: TetR/AcrR family transcriptional regulator [Acidimicrobiales bacterium]